MHRKRLLAAALATTFLLPAQATSRTGDVPAGRTTKPVASAVASGFKHATAIAASKVRKGKRVPEVTAQTLASTVKAGGIVAVKGRVSGDGLRKVRLMRRVESGRWTEISTSRTNKARRYALTAVAPAEGVLRLRVVVRRTGSSRPGASASFRVVVAAPSECAAPGPRDMYSLLGNPGDHWDSSKTIGWKYNPANGYAGALDDWVTAFDRISTSSGLRFSYQGVTDLVAWRDDMRASGTQLVVSWATPSQVPGLAGPPVGVGGQGGTYFEGSTVEYLYGGVALDSTETLRLGFATNGAPTWGQVMVHELGHVVGLGHFQNDTQIMNPAVGPTNHVLGAGDLEGLRVLGPGGGCSKLSDTSQDITPPGNGDQPPPANGGLLDLLKLLPALTPIDDGSPGTLTDVNLAS